MCSIVGSRYPEKIISLIKQNSYRGEFSHSFTFIDKEFNLHTTRNFGPFKEDQFLEDSSKVDYVYILCHTQAPTGGLVQDHMRIHPVVYGQFRLMHNGILKQRWVDSWKQYSDSDTDFDTYQFVNYLSTKLQEKPLEECLYSVDGSYVGVLCKDNDFPVVFRNDSSVIHYKETMNDIELSSHLIDGFTVLPPFCIYRVNLNSFKLEQLGIFKSVNMPFFFG